VTWPGTFIPNPLDLSALGGDLKNLEVALQVVGADPAIDIVIVQLHADDAYYMWTVKGLETIIETIISFVESRMKPLIVVLPPGVVENERLKTEARLCQSGIAVYPSIERAARAIALTCRFYSNQSSR
jgi:acyl-CoA synthetase (NDP forming)